MSPAIDNLVEPAPWTIVAAGPSAGVDLWVHQALIDAMRSELQEPREFLAEAG